LAQEVKTRIENGGSLPVVFSQNSQWTKEALAQENLAPYVVAVRPAMQALAVALKKTFLGDEKRTFVIAILPCTCKKDAVQSVGLRVGEKPAVDLALTTAEIIEILRSAELDLKYVPASPWDEPFGVPSGSGYIADIGGGVAEGVLRCLASDRSFEGIRRIEYSGVRGYKSVRVGYSDINATVVCKDNAESLMQDVVSGNCSSAFVEVVGNPLGCVAGNGQPEADENTLRLRAYALYSMDKRTDVRIADEAEDTVALANAFAETIGNDGFDELEVELLPFEEVAVEEVVAEEVVVETVEETIEEPAPVEEKKTAKKAAAKKPAAKKTAGKKTAEKKTTAKKPAAKKTAKKAKEA
jgi:iron only hydrogenase large subunit-like protein